MPKIILIQYHLFTFAKKSMLKVLTTLKSEFWQCHLFQSWIDFWIRLASCTWKQPSEITNAKLISTDWYIFKFYNKIIDFHVYNYITLLLLILAASMSVRLHSMRTTEMLLVTTFLTSTVNADRKTFIQKQSSVDKILEYLLCYWCLKIFRIVRSEREKKRHKAKVWLNHFGVKD